MSINFNAQLQTYVAQDTIGQVLGVYDPEVHGTVEDFKRAMIAANA